MPEYALPELPQYGLMVEGQKGGDMTIYLTIGFAAAQHRFYLCDTTNYEQVARTLHKQIMDAGVQARRAKSPLIEVKGDVDAAVPKVQGGK